MSLERIIANTLRVAREDLDAARQLTLIGNRFAIYHCEQAAEKIIKAVLSSEQRHGGITHHLDELVDQVPDENPIKGLLRGMEHLSEYATAFRYVSDKGRIKPSPPPAEVERTIQFIARALAEVVERLGVDLDRPDAPAKRPGPIR